MSKTSITVFIILLLIGFSVINTFWIAVLGSKHRFFFKANIQFIVIDIIIIGLVCVLFYYKKKKIMKKLVYSILFISSIAFSQTEKEVGDFSKVTSFDKIDVTLVSSDENKVILSGDNSEKVELINKNGELKIRMPLARLLDGDNISATVYYKEIDAVEANEGSRISSNDVFKTTSFDIIAKEGAEVKLKVAVSSISVKSSSGATIRIEGTSKNQNVTINSGGLLYANNLETDTTTITINAGGNAEIFANDVVDAKVRAGGVVKIYGKPKQINQKTFAGGRIEEVK